MRGEAEASVATLLRFVRQTLLRADSGVPDAAGWCALLPAAVSPIGRRPHPGVALPVGRWWPRAERSALPALRPVLAALAPHLVWTRNPNYRARPPHHRFLHRYGYAVILGPDDRHARPLIRDDRLALGLLLLGPGNDYPLHHHPAEEIYVPLSGTALWLRGDAPWRAVAPGRPIHHPPDLPHATRTNAAPLIALYLWRGALATHARLNASD